MEALRWIAEHWIDLLQTFVGGGIFFFAYSTRDGTKARKISNLIALNAQHADVWKIFYDHPELERVLSKDPELKSHPISVMEREFTTKLILNLSVAYRAAKCGELIDLEGLKLDAIDFFSLPIPKEVWDQIKRYQNKDFSIFVDDLIR